MSDLDDISTSELSRASTPEYTSTWEQDLMLYCSREPINIDSVRCIVGDMCYVCLGTIPVFMHIKYNLADPATLYVYYHDIHADMGLVGVSEVIDVGEVGYLYNAIDRHKRHVMERTRYYCL